MVTTHSLGLPWRLAVLVAGVVSFVPLAGCQSGGTAPTEHRVISPRPTAREFSRAHFSNPLVIDNSWTPLIPGTEFVLDGVVHEGGKTLKHRIVSLVTDMKKVVDGIPTVVVLERDFRLGKLQESELFFAAQDDNKTVWLFGEYPEVWDDKGRFQGAPEAFMAPAFGTQPGVFMYESPRVGQIFSQAYAPHVKFYDRARIINKDLKVCTPTKCYKHVLEVDEYAPFSPGDAHQHKFYAKGFGTIFAKPAGEPNPETVSLHEVLHPNRDAMAAARDVVLKQEARAYRDNDAYRQTSPAVPR